MPSNELWQWYKGTAGPRLAVVALAAAGASVVALKCELDHSRPGGWWAAPSPSFSLFNVGFYAKRCAWSTAGYLFPEFSLPYMAWKRAKRHYYCSMYPDYRRMYKTVDALTKGTQRSKNDNDNSNDDK